MEWVNLYHSANQPTAEQISQYIANPLWEQLNAFLKDSYQAEPLCQYSSCSGQPGWNIKYQKSGRSLCTLYPMPGFFTALVVIGNKEQPEAECLLPSCSGYVQRLYANTPFLCGGRWLMIEVTEPKILEDVQWLVQLRRKIKTR